MRAPLSLLSAGRSRGSSLGLVAVVLCSTFASPAAANVLSVPGQYPTIQAAIDAAAAGDTILVQGGTYGPIVVDKALAIVGKPRPTIDNTATPFQDAFVKPAVTLLGSGSGVVRLVNVRTHGDTTGSFYPATAGGVVGGGFAELHLEDCDVEPAEWFLLTGLGVGAPGVSTTVPYVQLVRTKVRGGASDLDSCDPPPGLPAGAAAVLAPASTVVAIDCDVRGGAGVDPCFTFAACPGPCPCPALGGFGGPGVVCDLLLAGGTQNLLAGGPGGAVTCHGGGDVVPLGTQPDGEPVVAREELDLGRDLAASGPLELGQPIALVWTAGPSPVLLLSTPRAATQVDAYGWLFLDPGPLVLLPVSGGFVQATLPNLPAFAGASVALQLLDRANGLSVPYLSTVLP